MFKKEEKFELANLIRELLDPNHPRVSEAQRAVKDAQPHFDSAKILHSVYLNALGVPLVEKLQNTEPLSESKHYVLHSGFGGSGFNAGSAAFMLLNITENTGNAEFAIDWLQNLLQGGPRDGHLIMLLSDIEIDQAIELSNGINLLPSCTLKLHPAYQPFLRKSFDGTVALSNNSLSRRPTAALVKRYTLKKFLFKNDEPNFDTEPGELGLLFDDIRAALSLVGPCAPSNIACWFHFDDPHLATAAGLAYAQGPENHKWPRFCLSTPFKSEEAKLVVTTYLNLSLPFRQRLRSALDRFNKAMQQCPNGDKALDLAVVLESLIIGDRKGEIGFRLALRCALLLGGSLDDRRRTRAIVSTLYDQRSKLAHKNESYNEVKIGLKPKIKMPIFEFLSDCEILVHQVLRVLLTRGEITDEQWAEIELGGTVFPQSPLD